MPSRSLFDRVLAAHGVDRHSLLLGIQAVGRAGQQLVRGAFDEAADDLASIVAFHLVERRHQLVGGVKRHLGHPRVRLAGRDGVDASLVSQHDQRALGGVADQFAILATASEASAIGKK